MGHTGTGMVTDFQTRGHTAPVTVVSRVFAMLRAHPLSKDLLGIFSYFFLFFMIFSNKFFQKRMILMAGALLA